MRGPGLLNVWMVLPILGASALESVLAAPAAPLCASTPTFVWGGHASYLDGVNTYESGSMGHDELTSMVHGFREHPMAPEVAVVMVLPSGFESGRDNQGALYKAMTTSASSKVIPCVTRSSSMSLEDLLTSSTSESFEGPVKMQSTELVATMTSRPETFSDGKLDVIVTSFPSDVSAMEVDDMLDQVSRVLERSVPHGRYLVFQTSEFGSDHPVGGPVRRKLTTRRLAASAPYYETSYVYVTPNILAGLLTVVVFFFITYIGVSCLAGLQTPSKFIHGRIAEGKEF